MMNQPILVDTFCCAGGATKGYQRAGFFVVGVDKDPQPHYCGDAFVQMDALDFFRLMRVDGFVYLGGGRTLWMNEVAAWHGSPPCQFHTALTKGNRKREGWTDEHVDLIPDTRAFFEETGRPYVIENTQGAPLRRDLILCGLKHFGLRVFRHRYFELGGGLAMPRMECNGKSDHAGHRVAGWRHKVKYDGDMIAVYGDGGGKGSIAEWREVMGIDWIPTDRTVLPVKEQRRLYAEALPPIYTETIGRALMAHVTERKAA